jgi:hypothetical protein
MVAALVLVADSMVTVVLSARGQALAQQLGQTEQQMLHKVHAGIDQIFQTEHIPELLRAFANTTAFADRSFGVAYVVDRDDILVGFSALGAVTSDVAIGSGSFADGAIINLGASAGVNLGRWDHPAWTVFANGFYESQTIHGLDGHLTTTGVHVQREVVPRQGRWLGVAATTGLEYGRWTIGEVAPVHTHFTVTGTSNQSYIVDFPASGTLDVRADTYTVPLEVTTGVLFGVLGVYGGGGIDATFGSSDINAVLDGNLTINKDMEPIGTATVTESGHGGPSTVSAHALAGLELHTRHVRIYAQGAIAPSDESLTLGLRIAP